MKSYLEFKEFTISGSRKTKLFAVLNKTTNYQLGVVGWYGPFRKYSFFTSSNGDTYDSGCLREIAAFLDDMNAKHKARRKNAH